MSLEAAYFVGISAHGKGYELGNIHVDHIVLYAKLFFYNWLVAVVLDVAVRAHMDHEFYACILKAVKFSLCYLKRRIFVKV